MGISEIATGSKTAGHGRIKHRVSNERAQVDAFGQDESSHQPLVRAVMPAADSSCAPQYCCSGAIQVVFHFGATS